MLGPVLRDPLSFSEGFESTVDSIRARDTPPLNPTPPIRGIEKVGWVSGVANCFQGVLNSGTVVI